MAFKRRNMFYENKKQETTEIDMKLIFFEMLIYLELQDKKKFTPLIYAVRDTCDPIMVKTLLQCNFDRSVVNLTDNQNNTALHYAALKNSLPFNKQKEVCTLNCTHVISLLINSGARHDVLNGSGNVALKLVHPDRKEKATSDLSHGNEMREPPSPPPPPHFGWGITLTMPRERCPGSRGVTDRPPTFSDGTPPHL
ncbi:hypothetical protein AAG570_004065 [Ranatra chinensis]|uniref:Uncharacterized protein n=1 Tax=Ranatra chinensis TaxID=642074 RepID=A0ABD0Y410_9HEMI